MNKRQFLGAVAAAGALPSLGAAAPKVERGPTLLTVTGAIANRTAAVSTASRTR